MCSSSDGSKYATLFCALYDDQQRTLRYVNAGHNPPILLRRDPAERSGEGEASLNGFRSIRLDRGGIVLGLFQDATYESETIQTLPGDLLVVYTDGVTEAFNAEGEEFGEERLLDALKRHAEGSAAQIRDAVLREVDAFVGEAPQHDDLTMMVFRVL
jgi:sigma-B regulation protein RsbU (phosphoserine phosphatase)